LKARPNYENFVRIGHIPPGYERTRKQA